MRRFMLMLTVLLLSSPFLPVSIIILFVTYGLRPPSSERSGEACFFFDVVRSLLRRSERLRSYPLTKLSLFTLVLSESKKCSTDS